ncbi:phosphate ABC transporter permease subunit PstC [Deltaproteobacteria bacterium]|nr:phosphate ABC transporter permease subunit PstC [Deltaproteobacteria bacterium]
MRRPLADATFAAALRPASWIAVVLPGLIAVFVGVQAWPALRATGGLPFVMDSRWAPPSGQYNLLPMIAGTLVSSIAALILVGPVAVAYGLHVNLFAGPRLAAVSRAGVGLLAGVPSVVFGLVALTRLVPLLVRDHPPGLGLGVTVVTLAAMVLPTAASAIDAAIQQVPTDGIRAVRALGLGAWDGARGVVLPMASRGIRTGLVLALGRAVGETMAVLMVAGNTVQYPTGPFTAFRTLTGNVAVEMAYAMDLHRSALFVSAALLFALVAGILALEHRRA